MPNITDIPNQKDYKNLTPFDLVLIQKFPFIEEDFDAINLYGILSKIKDYLNNVIANEQIVTENQQNVYNSFIGLHNFVENYFDNLDVQEEINNKLDEMVEDGTFEEIVSSYMNKKVDYFKITTSDSENDILEILSGNQSKVVEFEQGVYEFTDYIILGSNTTILLNGSELKRASGNTTSLILGYPRNSEFTEYNGNHNIKIKNGKISIPIALMHNYDMDISNITFTSKLTTHAIQIGACKNIEVSNCEFNGIVLNDSIGNNTEMIQLEASSRAGQPYLIDENSPSYDGYGNFGISIHDNIFNAGDNINSKFYCGIGHHSYYDLNPYPQKNIDIYNNVFYNSAYSDISIVGLDGANIHNNRMYQENDVNTVHIRLRHANKNVNIYDNYIKGGGAIVNANTKQNENFQIFNNYIERNKGTSYALSLQGFKNTHIFNNIIKFISGGVYISQPVDTLSDDILIENNYFENLNNESGYGVNVVTGTNIKILNNSIKQIEEVAFVYYNGTVNKNVLVYLNNYVENSNSKITGSNVDYSKIFGVRKAIYNGQTTYEELTEQTTNDFNLSEFNTLILLVHKPNDAAKLSHIILKPYDLTEKLSARKYYISVAFDDTIHTALFEINQDGTFNFSAPNEDVTLRRVLALNEV